MCGETITGFLRRYSEEPLDGKYRVVSVLGIGGMGEVYKAEHIHLHAPRVIKLMRANIANDRDAHERFLREARLATRIQHQNVIALFDFSALPDGSFYMVWEYVDGVNLRKFVEDRQFLRPDLAVRLGTQALMGLEAIHRAGIVHRDISPENLMVTRDEHGLERVKLIDLGVAKQWDDPTDSQTKSGMFVGKFKYCSPEQLGMLAKGERIDGRSDIYSFGLVLYEMLTGVAPFEAETPHHYLVLQTQHMPPPLRQANPQAIVPSPLELLIFRALAKDREKRFNTAYEFARALEAALPAIPQTMAYPSTVVSALPVAQSIADVPTPAPARRQSNSSGKHDLYNDVAQALAVEQYARADAALQTLKMRLGVKAETDGEFRRLRKELEITSTSKESWYAEAIESAKQQGKPKEVQRLLADRDERLGRRLAPPALKFETEVWLRRRDELLTKARTWTAAESFANAGRVLDELAEHLERGAATDDEYVALRTSFQQALLESSEKMRQEIVAAHASENIGKTRRLLSLYEAKFGQERRKHGSISAAEAWVREMDGMRGAGTGKTETTEVRRVRKRAGMIIFLIIVLILAAALATAWYYRPLLFH
jgi:serine/threonine protein kinase